MPNFRLLGSIIKKKKYPKVADPLKRSGLLLQTTASDWAPSQLLLCLNRSLSSDMVTSALFMKNILLQATIKPLFANTCFLSVSDCSIMHGPKNSNIVSNTVLVLFKLHKLLTPDNKPLSNSHIRPLTPSEN